MTIAPVELLQRLIRFDTTNPPGNEADCIAYLATVLRDAGIEPAILARAPNRPNLVARLPGRGAAPPLLLYGHVDVVTTAQQRWTHPPFAGQIADGAVWGRGALDMKGGIAMMLAAVLRAAGESLPGDVVLAFVSDEEAGGRVGARFLVEEHPDRFAGVRFAIGELGGFSFHFGGRRFYPIMVAEKQVCAVRATFRGPGGHGALSPRGGALAALGQALVRLDRRRLPFHLTPVARQMIEAIAAALPQPGRAIVRGLLHPLLADRLLDLLGERGAAFAPLLHNTATPTIVRGGEQRNVVPSEVVLELDGRVLPGFGPEHLLAELRGLLGDAVALEVLQYEPGPPEPDLTLFPTLAAVLRELDPAGVPVPLLLSGTTDARFFARLGIQTYGFLPLRLPPDLNFIQLFHGADERVPIAALDFGAEAIYRLLHRLGR